MERVTLCILVLLVHCCYAVNKTNTYSLALIDWMDELPAGSFTQNQLTAVQMHTAGKLAIELLNEGYYPDLVPNTFIELKIVLDFLSPPVSSIIFFYNFINLNK